ncbi:HAMP domain-containing histidine kinase [Deferribacterales bacterium Es71-Z0220]|uniref:ATP-binding protein n=1 Tax=Deferrivibrio essentukiensis TaxID=2880922 RepID=UPI001F613F45|nr:ATP-binding protein [Deferrivibrio essentukiensis]MCB4205359.1 HAMP domain-containing histidine kinase [Deferrivibrio essentukiensis]
MSIKNYYIPGNKFVGIFSLIFFLVIMFFHHTTPSDFSIIHIVHYYMLYIIVIIMAMNYGLIGGILASFVITISYAPNIYFNIFELKHYHLRSFVEVLMMYTLGIFAAFYSQKLYLEKIKVQNAYKKLEAATEEKIRMEKEFAKSEKLRALGQLSAGIAHEIRNPLASLKSAAKLIKSGKNIEQLTDILVTEIDRLNSFIERFLQYARFGRIENKNIFIKNFYMELLEWLKLATKSTNENIKIIENYQCDENAQIKGDINNLKQAFINIFLNSVEELKSNNSDRKIIEFAVNCEDEKIIFCIKDNGRGISENIKEKIFEPFFTTKESGSGLGLTITSKIISEHEGDLKISNNNGAQFTISLKKATDEDTAC